VGFDAVQVLMQCKDVDELDEAYRILNNFYGIYRGQLEVIGNNNNLLDGGDGF
jgi:hypothetical protein